MPILISPVITVFDLLFSSHKVRHQLGHEPFPVILDVRSLESSRRVWCGGAEVAKFVLSVSHFQSAS